MDIQKISNLYWHENCYISYMLVLREISAMGGRVTQYDFKTGFRADYKQFIFY